MRTAAASSAAVPTRATRIAVVSTDKPALGWMVAGACSRQESHSVLPVQYRGQRLFEAGGAGGARRRVLLAHVDDVAGEFRQQHVQRGAGHRLGGQQGARGLLPEGL